MSGTEVGRATSSRAPVVEKFRTTQLIRLAPTHAITAAWEELARDLLLRSPIAGSRL
jgi:hypothetical protein